MIASPLAGWIWITFGAKATFLFSGLGALLIAFYVLVYTTEAKNARNPELTMILIILLNGNENV